MKKETDEEAAENYNDDFQIKSGSKAPHIKNQHIMNHFIAGAKYQAERMYSEEDLRRAYTVGKHGGVNQTYYDFDEWFEQFKKK